MNRTHKPAHGGYPYLVPLRNLALPGLTQIQKPDGPSRAYRQCPRVFVYKPTYQPPVPARMTLVGTGGAGGGSSSFGALVAASGGGGKLK